MNIQLQNVTYTYAGKYQRVTAVDGVSYTFHDGTLYTIMGASGSGKSTLLSLLAGLKLPTEGEITLDEQPIRLMDRSALRRDTVSVIYQDFNLFPLLTAEENVCYPLRLQKMDKEKALELARQRLTDMGIRESYFRKLPNQLSGGEQQRVAIARALATDPKVLLCDEATSALDPTTTNSILALLKELNQKLGVTVVIITHQMSVIEEICTRVAILDGGEVAEEGRVEDIFAHPATDAARRLVYPGGVSAKQYPAGTRAVRVSFNGGTVYDPLIASLAIDCGVKVTILGADTRTIDGKAFGTMLLLLPDDPNEAAKALSYIRSQPNITAEEVEYHA